jgi:adenosine deaminase
MRQNNRSQEVAELAVKYRDQGVVGFDIAGPEDGFPPSDQLSTFEYLRRENAHFTIHAGEAYGLPSIWEAIQLCGAERLGHGVRIVDDIDFNHSPARLGRLAAYVRDRRVPLELCPSSNIQTGVADSFAHHPLARLAKLRFRVTINTDNRLMSATSMSREMYQMVKECDWTFQDLQRVTINALKSAFIPFEERLAIIEEVIKPNFQKISGE